MINGDPGQIDLPRRVISGLKEANLILKNVKYLDEGPNGDQGRENCQMHPPPATQPLPSNLFNLDFITLLFLMKIRTQLR